MKDVGYVKRFQDLVVYRLAREMALEIFERSEAFPKEERYALTDQIRRASRSIGAQIAEAWGKRRYERHFISKLTDADAEQLEVQHWLLMALDCDYLSKAEYSTLMKKSMRVGQLIGGMISKSDTFCGIPPSIIQEDTVEYFIEP